MASIYSMETGQELTAGLRGSAECEEAIQAAERHADELCASVELVDDDGRWEVFPAREDGTREPARSLAAEGGAS